MKEIVVVSGKGGTGKTSITAACGQLASGRVAMGDCDVDASNLALLLPGKDIKEEPFEAGERAKVIEELCSGCGLCSLECRFRALSMSGGVAVVSDLRCEGCRLCGFVCPENAIEFEANRAGTIYWRETQDGPLVHAALGVAQDNSGKLVAKVRQVTARVARERGLRIVLFDGPPGIGCPVHAAVGGTDLVVVVTEPSVSGAHDFERIVKLSRHFDLPVVAIVNKVGLHSPSDKKILELAGDLDVRVLAQVPFDPRVPSALARGLSPLTVKPVAERIEAAWEVIFEDICLPV